MATRDTIIEAATRQLTNKGLASFTVGRVARAAHVSSALVHYHFATKRRLLLSAATAIVARRTERRLAALQRGRGLATLDALWDALATGGAADTERAWPDLLLLAREDAAVSTLLREERASERQALASALPRLLADLESRPGVPADDLASATVTLLDGVASALAAGADADEVRAAFDAFWLALVALGQGPPGR